MAEAEKNILGLVSEDDWLDLNYNITRPNDPIDGLLGDEKTDNISAKWQTIASQYQVPMMAHFHAFDTETNTSFRIPVDTHSVEKGLIKAKLNQTERLTELLRSGVREDALYDYVIQDGARLADQVVTRTKVAKNELLATGKITIKENHLDLTVEYGVPAENTSLTLTVNDKAATDVPGQIQAIIDKAADNGVTINGILTSRKVISKLRANKSIQTAVGGVNTVGQTVRRSDFDTYMSEEFGIDQIITNDLTYGADATFAADGRPVITQKRYFPQDVITFFGTANGLQQLGIGLWGDSPEALLASQTGAAPQSDVSPYVYVNQWVENDPAVLWTKASALFMPVLYNPNSLYIAKVAE